MKIRSAWLPVFFIKLSAGDTIEVNVILTKNNRALLYGNK